MFENARAIKAKNKPINPTISVAITDISRQR